MKHDDKGSDFCPIAKVAMLLGDPSTLLIIRDLLVGRRRFKDLEASLSPVSSRTIAKKLKLLEEEEIILREEFKEKPPRVEYSLTKKGEALGGLLEEMRAYGKKFL